MKHRNKESLKEAVQQVGETVLEQAELDQVAYALQGKFNQDDIEEIHYLIQNSTVNPPKFV